MGRKRPYVIACIPAYNEEANIAKVVIQTKKHVDKVIVCDDGSTDMTSSIAEALGAEVLKHERNMGKGAALKTLFSRVKDSDAYIVVTLDADGQHDPNEIPGLIEPIVKEEADVVIGSRFLAQTMEAPFYRRLGLAIVNKMSHRAGGGSIRDTQTGYRAYSRKVLDALLKCEATGYGVETEQLKLLKEGGFKIVEKPVIIRYKGLRKTSKKNPLTHGMELVSIALRLIIEERPLLFLGVPGTMLMLIGLGSGTYLLWYFNMTRYFSIPIALITLGTLFTGVILLITSFILYAIARLKSRK